MYVNVYNNTRKNEKTPELNISLVKITQTEI